MASDPNLKVRVKLHARCLVDKLVREAGEIVEIHNGIADAFGVRVDADGKELKAPKTPPQTPPEA